MDPEGHHPPGRKEDMRMEQVIRDAVEYIRELFRGNADGHGFEHALRVWRNTME